MNKGIVVIVDGDRAFVQAVSKFLDFRGFRAVSAYTGADGLAQLQSDNVRLAIVDVHLPDISGIEVVERLRASGRDLPFVLISADGRPEIEARCRSAGAVCFMTKPLAPPELIRAMSDALDKGN